MAWWGEGIYIEKRENRFADMEKVESAVVLDGGLIILSRFLFECFAIRYIFAHNFSPVVTVLMRG